MFCPSGQISFGGPVPWTPRGGQKCPAWRLEGDRGSCFWDESHLRPPTLERFFREGNGHHIWVWPVMSHVWDDGWWYHWMHSCIRGKIPVLLKETWISCRYCIQMYLELQKLTFVELLCQWCNEVSKGLILSTRLLTISVTNAKKWECNYSSL